MIPGREIVKSGPSSSSSSSLPRATLRTRATPSDTPPLRSKPSNPVRMVDPISAKRTAAEQKRQLDEAASFSSRLGTEVSTGRLAMMGFVGILAVEYFTGGDAPHQLEAFAHQATEFATRAASSLTSSPPF